MDRRRLVKWLIVVAIAVPLLVEGITLLSLLNNQFGDGDETGTPTPFVESVGEGDELLTETDQRETLREATLDGGDRWTLTLTVTVNNTGDRPYELVLGAVQTQDGSRVEGETTSGTIQPGESTTVTAQWSLSSGSLPDRLSVTAVEYDGEGGVARTVQRQVNLAHIPVQG
jgi:hypothetical protein